MADMLVDDQVVHLARWVRRRQGEQFTPELLWQSVGQCAFLILWEVWNLSKVPRMEWWIG